MNATQKFTGVALLTALLLLGVALPLHASEADDADRVRFLVKWQSEVSIATTFAAPVPVETYQTWPLEWQIIDVAAADAGALLAELQADPRVATITLDYPLEPAFTPNDPGVNNGTQWAIRRVGVDIAWYFARGQSITVAILDSGIDPNHPDLVGQLVPGFDFYSETTDTRDVCGHGTHVAGIVGAVADNGIGIAGVAHQAKLMPVKVIGDDCKGTYSRLIQGILYAVDNGARVIVISSGGTFEHPGLRDALIYARERNVLVVASAGNKGDDSPFYPGSFAEAFTISGTDQNDGRFDRSTYGNQIDLSAPAVSIYSTYVTPAGGSTYAYMTGTSMSSPYVGGVAALLLSLDPDLTLTDLETILRQTADDLGAPGWDPYFGWGRVNAWRALAAIAAQSGNIRAGNTRVPVMDPLAITEFTATRQSGGILVRWQLPQSTGDLRGVLYRATVPAFETATDIAELPLSAGTGSGNQFLDTQVTADGSYYYWLVQVDRTVEIAVSGSIQAQDAPDGQPDVTPGETPTDPAQPRYNVFIPTAQNS